MTDQIERVARAIDPEAFADMPLFFKAMMPKSTTHDEAVSEWGNRKSHERVRVYKQAKAAIAAATEWQDISTAPKDGEWILVLYSRGNHGSNGSYFGKHCCRVVHWRDPLDSNPDLDADLNPGRWKSFGPSSYKDGDLSHWMPLPTPPAPEQEEG